MGLVKFNILLFCKFHTIFSRIFFKGSYKNPSKFIRSDLNYVKNQAKLFWIYVYDKYGSYFFFQWQMSVIRLQYLLKLKSSASFHKRALKMEKSAIKNCYISVRGTIKGPVKPDLILNFPLKWVGVIEFPVKMSWRYWK